MARERKFSTSELFHVTKDILLNHGYEGFTFSVVAERLDVSRGTVYKYYDNKEELITDYMVFEMNQFLADLVKIESYRDFESQFEYLLNLIFKDSSIYKIIEMVQHIPININSRVKENIEKLEKLRLDMYKDLQNFIRIGREEQKLRADIPDGLLLGYIFQSIAIPNHFGIPHSEWVHSIKEVIRHGMVTKR